MLLAKTTTKRKVIKTRRHKPEPTIGDLKKITSVDSFTKRYVTLSVIILFATTAFWALLGANIQRGNADQSVNAYLFENFGTFRGAQIPGQHSFLIKWPLFLLIKLFGYAPFVFTVFTIGIVVVTVAILVAIMYRIERRPLVFGTLCLGLASVLLLVPAVPYAGGILPVNMAMITARNLEYLLYIASIALLIRSPRFRSRRLWVTVAIMSLLIASDKLFLTLSIGGALLAITAYALARCWNLVNLSAHWLISGLVAGVGAIGIFWFINTSRITHVVSQTSAGPYGLTRNIHGLVIGGIYAILGLLTNFGANPAFGTTMLRDTPSQAIMRLVSISGITFIINATILLGGVFIMWRLISSSLFYNKNKKAGLDTSFRLSIILIWTTVAAFCAFIVSNHDYVVDARYLTISLFAVFISIATFASKKQWQTKKVVIAGLILVFGILAGIPTVIRSYQADRSALSAINERNSLVAQALAQHPVNVLVGDYWRVIPTKLEAHSQLKVMPLSDCAQARHVLSSTAWQPDLRKHSFAYLLSFEQSPTDYPSCTLDDVITVYGRPNKSVLIAGTFSQPKEQLLFYDHGVNLKKPGTVRKKPGTVLPITLNELPKTSCVGPTPINIVAHEDDDLLFMNPDIIHDINAGYCIRTVYITAGDAGSGSLYWVGRERGSEAAYDLMDGPPQDIWTERIVKLATNEFVTIANPRGNHKISLIFMRLPDGNINGNGFKNSHYESLARLEANKISVMHSVDGQSSYTSSQLTAALTLLMYSYQPTEIRTQSNYVGHKSPDHSDHMAVGHFVKKAYKQYEGRIIIPLKFYIGYPIRGMPENISGKDLQAKQNTFFAYTKYDGKACGLVTKCLHNSAYGFYLSRQYQSPY